MNLLLPTVNNFNLEHFLGAWYEIARLPSSFQPDESTDISAVYTMEDAQHIRIDNRCRDENQKIMHAIGQAKIIDAEHGKLNVTFLPEGFRWIPFLDSAYWIFKIDEDYETALVGCPSLKSMWILHRETTLERSILKSYLQHAKNLGFDLDELIFTVHTNQPTYPLSTIKNSR